MALMNNKKENIFVFKGDIKHVKKVRTLISRIDNVQLLDAFPLDDLKYCAFKVNSKLIRKLKISKINNSIKTKKINSLIDILDKSKKLYSLTEYENFKNKNEKKYTSRRRNFLYNKMPSFPKKDNQTLHSYYYDEDEIKEVKKIKKLKKLSKDELIDLGNKIHGIKPRKPRKTASKQKWINFIIMFLYKIEDEL